MIEANDKAKAPRGLLRSSKWPAVRKRHLKAYPRCAVCGGNKKLEAHHIVPFHEAPALELEHANLLTLCENKKSGVNCHLLFGHLGNYKSINANVVADAHAWSEKIKGRMRGKKS